MSRREITNAAGLRFYLEKSPRGWFVGLVKGRHDMSGHWFPAESLALAAIMEGNWG